MYILSITPSHPARRASIGLITKFQCGARGVRGARGAVFRDTLLLLASGWRQFLAVLSHTAAVWLADIKITHTSTGSIVLTVE